MIKFVMTNGVKEIGCSDWGLVIDLIRIHFLNQEHFISFKNVNGNTVVTNGNEGHLVTIDNMKLFAEDVWAVYGDDGKTQYYTFMLPSEY